MLFSAISKMNLSEWEALVAKSWENALRRKVIDRDADFRKLNVNSNRVAQIVRDIWSSTGKELPVNVFFTAPTINRMAAAIYDGSAFVATDIVILRSGDESRPLFLFPGGPGNLSELNDLVRQLDYAGTIYGIAFSGLDGVGPFHDRFEMEAERALGIIRRAQPSGTVRLVGYSMGGITALETARLLRQRGVPVFLGLIDTSLNDHLWPYNVWAGVLLRKYTISVIKLLRSLADPRTLGRRASRKAPIGPRPRGTQLTYRFRDPHDPNYPYYSPYWSDQHPPNYTRVGANACRMKGLYRPNLYDGKVTFFVSARGDSLTCGPKQVWPKYLPFVEWVGVPGNHLSILVGRHAARLASEISVRMNRDAPDVETTVRAC